VYFCTPTQKASVTNKSMQKPHKVKLKIPWTTYKHTHTSIPMSTHTHVCMQARARTHTHAHTGGGVKAKIHTGLTLLINQFCLLQPGHNASIYYEEIRGYVSTTTQYENTFGMFLVLIWLQVTRQIGLYCSLNQKKNTILYNMVLKRIRKWDFVEFKLKIY
jgi:hypothetical protein